MDFVISVGMYFWHLYSTSQHSSQMEGAGLDTEHGQNDFKMFFNSDPHISPIKSHSNVCDVRRLSSFTIVRTGQ